MRRRTVHEALAKATEALRSIGLPSPSLDAEVLLCFLLKTTKEELLTHPERKVGFSQYKHYQALIVRRAQREPVAYITGMKEFFGRPFFVNENVLIPRPESEHLIEAAEQVFRWNRAITIADVGTGSGCLAITLALHFRNSHIVATDVSERALSVAKRNARAHGVIDRITFLHGSLLHPVRTIPLDCIVANLPYVPEDEVLKNPDLAFEPLLALRGHLAPEHTLKQFVAQWYAREDRPLTMLEIHPNQRALLEHENAKLNVEVRFLKDLARHDRVAVLRYRPLQSPE